MASCTLDSRMKCLTLSSDVGHQCYADSTNLTCVLCSFSMRAVDVTEQNVFLQHLLVKHDIVISFVETIANLERYLDYWKKRFQEVPYQTVCTIIPKGSCTNTKSGSNCLYILDSSFPEDVDIRMKLQQDRLRHVLKKQEQERNDNQFSRTCLFCKKVFSGNRSIFFQHLLIDHNFHVGAPDNIVFGNELLDLLQEKLKQLQCFYCEKIFKDWGTLKEHMRKKQHKRINPKNRTYDKFYIINYLELGKNWQEVHDEDDYNISYDSDDKEEDNDMDCQEEHHNFVCLFCDMKYFDFDQIIAHMKDVHGFDFVELKDHHQLDFYKRIKLINYIRKQVHEKICISCDEIFNSHTELITHMTESGHISQMPDDLKWNQPMYYFPTYENDNLLCALDDPAEESDSSTEPCVLPEDTVIPKPSVLYDEEFRNSLF